MSKVAITDTYLTNIANAIRSKSESSDTYTPSEMASAILNIPSGGTEGVYKVSSVAEMNAIENPQNNDICLIYDTDLREVYHYISSSWVKYNISGLLPTGYNQVNYIEGTGTQYIDTGYKPYKTKTELKFAYQDIVNTQLIGGVYDGNRDAFYYMPDMNFKVPGSIAIRNTARVTLYSETANSNIHVVRYNDGGKVYYDDQNVGNVSNLSGATPNTMYLFANHGSSGADIISKARIYYCKIWDNGILVRDYVPCVRTSDNEVGLYDTVNDVFYTNAGTGTFVTG